MGIGRNLKIHLFVYTIPSGGKHAGCILDQQINPNNQSHKFPRGLVHDVLPLQCRSPKAAKKAAERKAAKAAAI